MLQVNFIRQNRDTVIERLALKGFKNSQLVDAILSLDDERKKLTLRYDESRGAQNRISDEVRLIAQKGDATVLAAKKTEATKLKISTEEILGHLNEIEKQLQESLVQLPNLPHSSVPAGHTPQDNEQIREGGIKPVLHSGALSHWDLAKKFGLIDFDLGNKVTGAGFPVYTNRGARLQRALIGYFLDYNTGRGYREYQLPYLVNEASAFGTGQLPDKEAQMYAVPLDKLYLIPTAEVPLTNLYRDTTIPLTELPVKMTAYTPCFRREAGSYGSEVRGLNRLHQFDKAEIVQLTLPEKSYEVLEEMVKHVEQLVQELELPYRILRLCGGDMSFASALTYDFEVWSAAQQKWLEVSSVSNFETFQTNRMKIRFRDERGKPQLVHSLNGSSLALPRILAALLENNQDNEGIRIPKPLQGYFGGDRIS